MPKKTFGKKLEIAVKKVGTQLSHRAAELSKALHTAAVDVNNAGVNQTLEPVRHQSKAIQDAMTLQFNEAGKLLVQSRTTVGEFQTKFQNLERQTQDIKNNQEIVAQLQRLLNGNLGMVNGAMTASEMTYSRIVQDDLLGKATAECNAISNAPKDSAPKKEATAAGAGPGASAGAGLTKAPEYSKEVAQKLADEALARLKIVQSAMATACQEITGHHDYIKNAKDAIEKALKEIGDKIVLFSAYEAARPAAVAAASDQEARLAAMQRQILEAQAEISRLRSAAGLGSAPAASATPQSGLGLVGPAFTPMASPMSSALPPASIGADASAGVASLPTYDRGDRKDSVPMSGSGK